MTESDHVGPPNLRKTPIHPEYLFAGSCETCVGCESIGFWVKYQTPAKEDDLRDGYLSVLEDRKRMWTEQRELRASRV